jgi:hypothetical protein
LTREKPEHEAQPQPNGGGAAVEAQPAEDVVVLTGFPAPGDGMSVVRIRNGDVELGVVQPLKEGKPITGELVRLHPRRESPMVCDVEVELDVRPIEQRARSGPPQVATERYRKNWDAIFPAKKPN